MVTFNTILSVLLWLWKHQYTFFMQLTFRANWRNFTLKKVNKMPSEMMRPQLTVIFWHYSNFSGRVAVWSALSELFSRCRLNIFVSWTQRSDKKSSMKMNCDDHLKYLTFLGGLFYSKMKIYVHSNIAICCSHFRIALQLYIHCYPI